MIDLDAVRNYCLNKKGKITEEFPFDENVLVFKIYGKIFLLTDVTAIPMSLNLKCDPERAVEFRERYDAIRPGFHMNKSLWNTVKCNGSLQDTFIYELIDHSYDEVVKKFSKKLRATMLKKRSV